MIHSLDIHVLRVLCRANGSLQWARILATLATSVTGIELDFALTRLLNAGHIERVETRHWSEHEAEPYKATESGRKELARLEKEAG